MSAPTALDVLLALKKSGVELRVRGDKLTWSGPENVVTAMHLATLLKEKRQILEMLDPSPARQAALLLETVEDPVLHAELRERFEERAAICEFVGGATRGRAERIALEEIDQVMRSRC